MRGDCRSRGARGAGFCGLVLAVVLVVVLGCGAFDALYAQGPSGDDGTAVMTAPSDAVGAGGAAEASPAMAPVARFGYKAAVSGNTAVVGAEWHNGFEGMAYLYRRDGDTWVEAQKLAPSDLGRYDHFGSAVAMSGDVAFVGAPWQDLFRGAVYVFVREGDRWVEREKLTASDGSVEGYFGRSVFIDGNGIVVTGAGPEAYRFERTGSGWVEKGKTSSTALRTVDAAAEAQLAEGIVFGNGRDPAAFFGKENVTPPSPAPMAPAPPDWVKATGGSLSPLETEVNVTWSVSEQQDAIVFKVYRDGTLLSLVPSVETQYSDKTAVINSTYPYCVVASDMMGGQSAPVCDPEEGKRIIFAPTGVSATDGIYTDKVQITWMDMSTINTGYSIRRESDEIGTVGPNVKLFDDTTAEPDSVYLYHVVATVTGGYESADSTDTGWQGVILPPKNVSASDGQYLDRVRITWENQAPDTLVYAVYRDGSLLGVTAANATSYVDSTVAFGVTYTYCVATKEPETLTGIPAAGVGANGPIMTESVKICDEGGTGLAAPSEVSASDSTYDDRIRITWKDNCKIEDGYQVSRKAMGTPLMIDTTRAGITLYDDFTATPGVTYMYNVRAISNLGGMSAAGSNDGFRSKVLAPYEVAATDGTYEDYVNVTWKSTSTTAALFNVYRGETFIKSLSKGDRLFTDYGGTAGEKYQYTVRAYTALGDSAIGTADEGWRELESPTPVTATDETYEDRVVVSWTNNSARGQGYVVSRRDTVADPLVGSYDTPGTADAVAVVGDYAYVADGSYDLQIVDISDPANPVLVGSYDTPDGPLVHAHDVCVSGDYAYVANGYDGGLQIFDISDPANPMLSANCTTLPDCIADRVAVAGDYAYVSDLGGGRLNIIDVRDPSNLSWVGLYAPVGGFQDVAIQGNYAYLGCNFALEIVDVSNPSNPYSLFPPYSTTGPVSAVAVNGAFAYAGVGTSILVINVGDPAAPTLARTVDIGSEIRAVRVVGKLLYACASSLYVVDLSDPAATAYSVDTPGSANDVAVIGNHALVADGASGLQVCRASAIVTLDRYVSANQTSYTDYTAVPGVAYRYSVAAFDDRGLARGYSVAAEDLGNRVLPVPTNVRADKGASETQVEVTWSDNSAAEDGYRVYRDFELVGSTRDNFTTFKDTSPVLGRTHVYEVRAFDGYGESMPGSDSGKTMILAPASVNASEFYEDRVDVTWVDRSGKEEGFNVYRDNVLQASVAANATSFTDYVPGHEEIVGSVDTPGFADDVAVFGNYAYVADGGYLEIIDISVPGIIKTVGPMGNAVSVAVSGNYAYVADADYFDGRLHIVDISVPGSASIVQTVDTPGRAHGVAVSGNYAYVADLDAGLHIIDISVPGSASIVKTVDMQYSAWGISVSGNYAYVADVAAGLQIIDISVPASASVVKTVDTPGTADDVTISGKYAYVADAAAGLQIIDISVPGSASIVKTVVTPGNAVGVAVAGSYAFVAGESSGLQVIDISVPASASRVKTVDTPGSAVGVAVAGNYAYVGDSGSGLQIISIPTIVPGKKYEYSVQAYNGTITAKSNADFGQTLVASDIASETTQLSNKLVASDAAKDDHFGWSVGVDQYTMIIGAPEEDKSSDDWDAGAVYIFEREGNGWRQQTKLVAPGRAAYDFYGHAVAISGDIAIVGEPGEDAAGTNDGKAYMLEYDGTNWSQTFFTPPSSQDHEAFGKSVAVSDSSAVVGAPGWDIQHVTSDYDAGRAFILTRGESGWVGTEIKAFEKTGWDSLGWSAGIDGGVAIVGAPGDDDGASGSGSVYVFEYNTATRSWPATETRKLTASDKAAGDAFGWSVAISGNTAIVGAPRDDDKGPQSGSAYVFVRNSAGEWIQEEKKLLADDGSASDRFGYSVAIRGDVVIVGAPYKNSKRGAVYIFKRDAEGTWIQTQKATYTNGASGDYLGWSAAVTYDMAVFGAMEDAEAAGIQQGTVSWVGLTAKPTAVAATDGTLKSRVKITWEDRSLNEEKFTVFRDGVAIADVGPNVEVYEDFDAEPGRTYTYGVGAFVGGVAAEIDRASDLGWRPANGNITGRIATRGGAAAQGIKLAIDPLPTKALLFDGSGGYVFVPDDAAFAFTKDKSYTVEAWVKYVGSGGNGAGDGTMIAKAEPGSGATPFSIGNLRSAGQPGRIYFKISDGTVPVSVSSTGAEFNDNTWHHLACVHDAAQDEIRLYVDGVPQGSATYTSLGAIANTEPLTLGAGPTAGSWFGGQIDEVRIWGVARTETQINEDMGKQLAGDETGLLAYWPLDEGSVGTATGGNAAITDFSAGGHYGQFVGGVYWTGNGAPLDIYPVTDDEGNYILRGIRYGNLAEFKIRPFDGERQFDPAYRVVTLTQEDPVENQVNFQDISAFTVSGVVRYAGTNCPAPDVQILVDDSPLGVTDKNGKFAVSVDYMGEDYQYSIKPALEGHTFEPEDTSVAVDHDILLVDPATGVTFADATTRKISGSVGGGCGRSIGEVVITIQAENGCLLTTLATSDSAYSIELPPQAYLLSASVVEDSIPPGLNPDDVVKYFQTLGERRVDLASEDAALDFVYHAPLVVTITGMESFVTCDQLTFDGRTLPEDLPVVPQETIFELAITVTENYGDGSTCPLDSGTVTIYDEIADRADKPFVLQVKDGVAGVYNARRDFIPNYRSIATTPSLIVGRTDERGNDRTYQKYVRAVANVEGRSPVTASQWALVTGHVAPEGFDFVTMKTPPMPFYVLRDPPGDKSYAYLEKGYTSSSTIDFDMESWTTNGSGTIENLKVGISATFALKKAAAMVLATLMGPLPAPTWGIDAIELNFAVQRDWQKRYTEYQQVDENGATVVTTAIDEVFSTSSNDLFTGGKGDVFVGAGLNYMFAEVGVLEVDDACKVIRTKSVGFEPQGFETIFAYSEQYITEVLIPEIESKEAYYRGFPDKKDSVDVFHKMAESWHDMLAENDSLKSVARLKANRSFSAGADYAYSFTSDTTETYRKSTALFKDDESDKGIYVNIFGFVEFEWLDVDFSHKSKVLALTDTTGTRSTTVGYVLSDDDLGDHFTVDIKQDHLYPSPVFDVRGGASSCPYEPWADPNNRARMYKRDNPWIDIVPARRDDVAPDQAAAFTLQLKNQSETEEPRLYALRLVTTSNPGGAIVKVGGETIMNGLQEYFIAPGDAALQEASLTVERGPTRYDYNRLAVILYAPCEYALWQQGAVMQAVDTVYFDVTFQDEGPVVFGTPEPADGELSFGEDISITFNEDIDCLLALDPSMRDSISLTYLDGPNAGSKINLHKTCNGRTIILDPQADPNDLEGRRLRARVSAVRDPAGNPMPSAVIWEFVYRKSRFTWSNLHLTREVNYLSPGVLSAELVNGTSETVNFTIAPPAEDWFAISPVSGTLPPGGVKPILLDIRNDLEIGVYEAQVTASTPDVEPGVALLNVYLTVTCSEPVWAVNPSKFEHSMTMVAELDMGGALSRDRSDKVAAFVGSQLRGVAEVDSVAGLTQPHVAFLTIYSNRASGETVRFQLWDDSACKLYNATDKTFPFVVNGVIGSPNAPETLTGAMVLGDSVLAIAVNEGWTWISTNVTSADMSVNGLLSDLTPTSGDIFKSQTAFSQYDESTGWSNGLVDVNNVSGYMIRLTGPGTILHTGQPVEAPFTIPVVRNWNWIGYLPNEAYPVAYALGGLSSLAVTGDVIKSQDAFAEYVSPNWYGSLDVLEPGKGYKLSLSNADPTPGVDSFDYPATPPPPGLVAVASNAEEKATVEGTPSWSVNPHAYQHNMTVTGVLRVGGVESIDERDLVGAFVGDECRGIAQPVYLEGLRRYEVFLMVHSNDAAGERVTLRAFDADAKVVYDVTETLTFEADKVHGTVQTPVALTTGTVHEEGGGAVPIAFALGQNRPNPFNPTTIIDYDVPTGGGKVSIRIYDVGGRLVRTLVDREETPGRKTVTWDGMSNGGQTVATGVYFYRMTAPGFEKTKKMVMMK